MSGSAEGFTRNEALKSAYPPKLAILNVSGDDDLFLANGIELANNDSNSPEIVNSTSDAEDFTYRVAPEASTLSRSAITAQNQDDALYNEPLQAAILSNLAYLAPNDDDFYLGTEAAKEAKGPWNWTVIARSSDDGGVTDNSHNYYGIALQDDSTGEVAIVSRGTSLDDYPYDFYVTDNEISQSVFPNAFDDALTFALFVQNVAKKPNPVTDYWTVGHSLGGAEAQFVAEQLGIGGTTFSAPGALFSTHVDDLNVTNYVFSGEPIGSFGKHVGNVKYIPVPTGWQQGVLLHSVDNYINYYGGDYQPPTDNTTLLLEVLGFGGILAYSTVTSALYLIDPVLAMTVAPNDFEIGLALTSTIFETMISLGIAAGDVISQIPTGSLISGTDWAGNPIQTNVFSNSVVENVYGLSGASNTSSANNALAAGTTTLLQTYTDRIDGTSELITYNADGSYVQTDYTGFHETGDDTYLNVHGGTYDLSSSLDITTGVVNSGAFTIDSGASLTAEGGLANSATFTISGVLTEDSSLENAGIITVANGGTLNASGAISNVGTIALDGTSSVTTLYLTGLSATSPQIVLSGGGVISMSDSVDNLIDAASFIDPNTEETVYTTLVNQDDTIKGAGTIGFDDLLRSSPLTLDNESAGVIDAEGTNPLLLGLSANSQNQGVMEADSGGTLDLEGIFNGTVDNTGGTIEALTGGIVEFQSNDTIPNITGGSIFAAGGTVDLGGKIFGATLGSDNGGALQVSDDDLVWVDDATLSAGSTLTLQNNSYVILGNTFINKGTVLLAAGDNDTRIFATGLTPQTVLSGGGVISMSDNADNLIVGDYMGSNLVNEDNTIEGAGTIGPEAGGESLTLVNQSGGVIDAKGVNPLILSLSGTTSQNQGLMEASAGGTLEVSSTIDDNGGTIVALSGGTVETEGVITGGLIHAAGGTIKLISGYGQIVGATLTADTGGTIEAPGSGGGYLDGVTISKGTTVTVQSGGTISLGDAIANKGTVALAATGSATTLTIQPAPSVSGSSPQTVLSGAGVISMSDSADNFVSGGYPATTLVNQNNTIEGAGTIGTGQYGYYSLTLINETAGLVEALGENPLILDLGTGSENQGLMEAAAKDTLDLKSGPLDGAGGTIEALTGGTVEAGGATITGGLIHAAGGTINLVGGQIFGATLTSDGGGTIVASGGYLDGVTISAASKLTVQAGGSVYLGDLIANKGTIALAASGSATILTMRAAPSVSGGSQQTVLSGGGFLTMSDSANNYITGAPLNGGGYTTLVNQDNTIDGAGTIGYYATLSAGPFNLTLVNESAGIIDAQGENPLIFDAEESSENQGVMEASAGGTLDLQGGAINNAGGTIQALAGGKVEAEGTTITGGLVHAAGGTINLVGGQIFGATLTSDGGGTIVASNSDSGFLDGVTISTGSVVTVQSGGTIGLNNTIANNGTIAVSAGDVITPAILLIRSASGTDLSQTTLSAGGVVSLSDSRNNYITGNLIDGVYYSTLVNQDNTIEGAGTIGYGPSNGTGLTLVNSASGVIDGDATNNALVIKTGSTLANAGVLESTATGGLYLDDAITNSGTIRASGAGVVAAYGAVDNLNTIDTSGSGSIYIFGAVDNSGAIEVNGGQATVDGGLENSGSIEVTSGILDLQGALSGTGSVKLDGVATLKIESASTGIGAFTFTSSASATLDVVSGFDPQNVLDGFDATDAIELEGFAVGTTESVTGHVLTVVDGGLTDTFNLDPETSYTTAQFGVAQVYSGALLVSLRSNFAGGGYTLDLVGGLGSAAALSNTAGDWDAVDGSGGTIYLASGQAVVTGGGDSVIFYSGSGNAATLADTDGVWDSVYGSGGTLYLESAQAAVTGGGDSVNFYGGSGDAVTVANTDNNWDLVNGSGGTVYLINGQANVYGGGYTLDFAGGSGNVVSILNTGGKWDLVEGSSGIIYLTNAQASVVGGGDSVNFYGGSGDAVTVASTDNNWDAVDGSGGTVYLASGQAGVAGGGDSVIFYSGSGNAATLADTGGVWDSVYGSGGTLYLESAQAAVTGGGDTVNFFSGSGDAVTVAGTGGAWDSVNGSGGTVYLTSGQAGVAGGGDTIDFAGGSGNAVGLGNTNGNWDLVSGSGGSVYMYGAQAGVAGNNDTIHLYGNNAVTQSGASDAFIFQPAIDKDTINGFTSTDSVQFSVADFANWSALSGHISQSGSNTLIQLDASDTITLTNVVASSLTASQFHFV